MHGPPAGVKLTVIYDNYSVEDELQAAWGFSCLVENTEKVVLFDTEGHGPTLMANMARLDIAPRALEAIVLSHAHWDHTGGLAELLGAEGEVTVYMLKSFPRKIREAARRTGARLVEISGPEDVFPGVKTTGEMSSGAGPAEQSLIIETKSGMLVLTGCAHPGVANIAERAVELTGGTILAVIGGYHLHRAGDGEVREVGTRLQEIGVRYVIPCHCSGDRAVQVLREIYGKRCLSCSAGEVIETARLD